MATVVRLTHIGIGVADMERGVAFYRWIEPCRRPDDLHFSVGVDLPGAEGERIDRIVKRASGFIYCVSREGVTGMQDKIAEGAEALVQRIKDRTDHPVALGFGIGTPAQARDAALLADAVVVGSAIVNRFHKNAHDPQGRAEAARFVGDMVKAVKSI